MRSTDVQVPESDSEPVTLDLADTKREDHDWIEHSLQHISDVELCKSSSLTWSAHHATQQQPTSELTAIYALLPIFYEISDTPAMIKHGMDVHRQATEYLNPGQIPVITFEQPLFALAKYVQWKWPDLYGEKIYVVMMGGLHIENDDSFSNWLEQMCKKFPTFKFWYMIAHYERSLFFAPPPPRRHKNITK